MMNVKTAAALPFLLFAVPAFADTAPGSAMAALPSTGGVICMRTDDTRTPSCNAVVTWCQEVDAANGKSMFCTTPHTPQLASTFQHETTVCQQDGNIRTCRTVSR